MASGDDRAVSHVVGVLLMIAITVLLFSVIGVMALTFDAPPEEAPRVASDGSFNLESNSGGPPTIALTHESGDIVDVSNVKVHVTTDSGTVVKDVPKTGELNDGEWSSGEKLEVPVQTDDVCGGGEEADIRLVYYGEERTTTMAEKEIPLQASEFEISGGSVVPEHDYSAEVELLGTGYPNTMDVEVQPIIGGDRKGTWSVDSHGDHSGLTQAFDDIDAGTGVAVRARGDGGPGWMHSERDDGDTVFVFGDGDVAPSFSGVNNQPDADEFITDHIDNSGQIEIADNQAIFFFEVATTNENSNLFDRQDAAVLVTFTSASGSPDTVEEGGETRVVCPA